MTTDEEDERIKKLHSLEAVMENAPSITFIWTVSVEQRGVADQRICEWSGCRMQDEEIRSWRHTAE